MFGRLLTLQPVLITTVKDGSDPDDYGVKMSVMKYEGGYQLCRHKSRTSSNIGVWQSPFPTPEAAINWATRRYRAGEKFDV